MKKSALFILVLIFLVTVVPLSFSAETLRLDKMLDKLTSRQATSLQKLELIEQYKGQNVRGSGKVKDVLKKAGSPDKAMVYMEKPFRNKKYEIVLMTSSDRAKDIKKGKKINFEGAFVGMVFETLRFEDAEF